MTDSTNTVIETAPVTETAPIADNADVAETPVAKPAKKRAKKTSTETNADVPAKAKSTRKGKRAKNPDADPAEVARLEKVGALIAQLRGDETDGVKPSQNQQKLIRRKLRSLGHRGGLKTAMSL